MEHFQQMMTPHLTSVEILLEGYNSSVLVLFELEALVHRVSSKCVLSVNRERHSAV